MNITHIMEAVQQLDRGIEVTFGRAERAELKAVAETLRVWLRRRGVFIGSFADDTPLQKRKRKVSFADLGLNVKQKKLRRKHGTPAEFAVACYKAVPDFIGMDEARAAVDKYSREWHACSAPREE